MNRRTSRTPRTFIGLVAALGLLVALTVPALAAPHEGNPGGNCDTTDTSVKTNTDDGSIVLAAGTIFCVKASDTNSGTLVADGETTLNEYLVQEGIDHNVSNYVVYGMATPTPTPTESSSGSTATPTPSPTPTPSESVAVETSTPTPTPSASERGGVEGGNPTPAPSGGELPDTAMGAVSSVPATLLGLIALLSVSALLYVRLAGVPARR